MANTDKAAIPFDQFIQQTRQKNAAESLAQKLLGSKSRRSSAPTAGPKSPQLTGSLASRVGVTKPRNTSIPRNNSSHNHRPAAAPLTRLRSDVSIDRPSRPSSTRPEVGSRSNSQIVNGRSFGGSEVNIRGAATGVTGVAVVAQNFAPGTTAADIESVMLKVGGEMTSCRLVSASPTVIAEMVFVEPGGAENVIAQFNGKKADGRTLYVFHRDDGGARRSTIPSTSSAVSEPEPEALPVAVEDDTMMLDEAAEAREANDRMREERRGREDRDRERERERERDAPRERNGGGRERERERERERDVFPAGPRGYGREEYYDRGAGRRVDSGGYGSGGYGGGYGMRGHGGGMGMGMGGAGGRYFDDRSRGYGRGGRGWR